MAHQWHIEAHNNINDPEWHTVSPWFEDMSLFVDELIRLSEVNQELGYGKYRITEEER